MNWLQKIASVTFSLEGSNKISQPKDIMTLSYELQTFASEKVGFHIDINAITPDGDDFDQLEGKINWYVTDKVTESQQIQIMEAWIREMQLMDYQIKVTGPDISGLNSPGESSLKVYRIHVLKNGSQDYMQIPEMNLANTNAQDLMSALGVPFDWSGSVDLNELKTKLEMFTPWHQQDLTKQPEQGGEGGAQWYQGGRTDDQVARYIDGLGEMVNFGLKNGFESLVWY